MLFLVSLRNVHDPGRATRPHVLKWDSFAPAPKARACPSPSTNTTPVCHGLSCLPTSSPLKTCPIPPLNGATVYFSLLIRSIIPRVFVLLLNNPSPPLFWSLCLLSNRHLRSS